MNRKLLLYVFLFLPIFSYGQFGEAQMLTTCAVCSPYSLAYADLDGDDLEDLIFIASNEDRDAELMWLKHQADHSFSQEPIVIGKLMDRIQSYYVVDYDGDGDKDIIVRIFKQLLWFENLETNQFSEAKILVDDYIFSSRLRVIDFDSDGDFDLLNPGASGIFFFRNEGVEEELEPIPISKSIKDFSAVSFIDVNEDGHLDAIVARSNVAGILYFENNGQDSLIQDSRLVEITSVVQDSFGQDSLVLDTIARDTVLYDDFHINYRTYEADFNNDGFFDMLVIYTEQHLKLGVLLNNGNNEFLEKIQLGSGADLVTLKIHDLNQDGYLDIFTVLEGKTYWYENDGQGKFSNATLIDFDHLPFDNLQLVDINKDGHIDLLTVYNSSSKIVWYENDGQINFTERIAIKPEITQPGSIHTADLDADGDTDILTASYIDNSIFWYQNVGHGQFSEPIVLSANAQGASHVITADLDNDAVLDVVAISDLDGKIAWFRNEGGGNFSAEIIITDSLYGGETIFASDLDGDGDKDLLFKDFNAIGWYENVDNGQMIFRTFVSHIGYNTPQRVFTNIIETIDIDKDGDEDIFMEFTRNGDLYWFENDGAGIFKRKNLYSTIRINKLPSDFSFGDINQNGNKDFAAVVGENVNWYYLLENGRSFHEQSIEKEAKGGALTTVDLEGDGDLDIVMIKDGGTIVWYENLGAGVFSEPKEIYTQERSISNFVMDDINGDGAMDIVFTTPKADGITWIQNFFEYPVISGISFWDKNTNGIFDEEEELLNNIPIQIAPLAASTYTDNQGTFNFYVANGDYIITAEPDSCWSFTTDSTYSLSIERDVANNVNFGFQLSQQITQSKVSIISAPTRCGFDVPFRLVIENDGCQPINGQYGLVVSPLVTLIGAELEPSYIRGDTLLWNYEELIASETQDLKLIFEIAGTDFIGDTIQLKGLSYIADEMDQFNLASTYDYHSEIRCAYDPNDKLVSPNRLAAYDQNYTLFGEELVYTIRFQNTGNDTAFNVVIRDTLDKQLDWSTFQPIIGSHTFEALLSEYSGSVVFSFKDILLPDSTTNEPLSHGFISYKIKTQKDLVENTVIENTANIYFDFNPPIITNTTNNILVTQLPQTTSLNDFSNWQSVKVYPNPFENFLTIEQNYLYSFRRPILKIFDVTGTQVKAVILNNATQQIATDFLGKGLYFYQIATSDGVMIASGKMVKQ